MSIHQKARIDELIAGIVQPKFVDRSGRLILKSGRSWITLAKDKKLTKGGKYFYEKTGKDPPPLGFDLEQTLKREKNKEYINVNGKRRLARSYDATTDTMKYTKMGVSFFKARGETTEYMVHIPVTIKGKNRKTGSAYERRGHLPHQALDMGQLKVPIYLSKEEQIEKVKQMILDNIDKESVLEVSDEKYAYDAQGAWRISTLITRAQEDSIDESVILNRPLQGTVKNYSHFFKPWNFSPEAFEETEQNCVIHQLSRQLGFCEEEIGERMTKIQAKLYSQNSEVYKGCSWQEKGITAFMLLEYAKEIGFSCHLLWGAKLIQSYVPENKIGNISAAIWGKHLYTYKDAHAKASIANNSVTQLTCQKTETLARPFNGQCSSIFDYERWDGIIKPGFFYTYEDSMENIKMEMIRTGRVPKVQMRNYLQTRSLSLTDQKGKETHVMSLPSLSMDIQDFAGNLSIYLGKNIISYGGQGLANFSLQVLIKLMKPQRTSTDKNGRCDVCGQDALLTSAERDHCVPVSLGGKAISFLCSACHLDKTRAEDSAHRMTRGDAYNPLLSHFNTQSMKDFLCNRPLQVVQRVNDPSKERGLYCDVKRCRRNALVSGYELPCFSALDDIESFSIEHLNTADFFYITGEAKDLISQLPWTGARWYHRCNATYLLEMGKITLNDITHSFTASGHLPSDAFEQPLKTMELVWSRCENNLSKQAINSLIGMMGARENSIYRCVMSTCEDDSLLMRGKIVTQEYGDVTSFVSKITMLESWSMQPIYMFCLDYERLMIAKITDIALSLKTPRSSIIEYSTDNVLIQAGPALTNKLKNITLEELGLTGKSNAFRIEEDYIRDKPKHAYDPLSSCDPPTCGFQWHSIVERDDVDVLAIARHIVSEKGEGLFLSGAGGTGKSWVAMRLVEELEKLGHKVVKTALTHVAARNLGGCTLASFVHKYILNGSFRGTLVVDEISLLGTSMLNFLNMLCLANVRFILIGDFAQLPPIANYWCAKELLENKFAKSRLLHTMSSGNILHLTKCRRSSGFLFDFYTSLYETGANGHLSIREMVELSRRTFPPKPGNARWNLCISHGKRQTVNRVCWLAECKGKELLSCKLSDEIVDHIFVGCPLIGCTTERNKTVNGAFYVVNGWDDEHVFIQDIETQETIDLPIKSTKNCRLGWSITYHAVQSRTLREHVRLHDVTHPRFTKEMLAMGLGRAVAAENLDVA